MLPRIVPLGEAGWTVVLGSKVDRTLHRRVLELRERIEASAIPGVIEVVPGYAVVTVFFDPLGTPAGALRDRLSGLIAETIAPTTEAGLAVSLPAADQDPPPASPLVTIPVRYTGEDLAEVSRQTGLSQESVVRMHAEREYVVYLLGFVPGFGYLGDLHPALVIPRRASPRTRVPAGSVAIAGAQTGVYPFTTPGGWHLIGSTPLILFDPGRNPPALLSPGARVRFEPIG